MHLPLQSNRNVDHLGERLLEEWLTNHGIITSTPVRVGSIAISLSVYLSVCLSARIYQKPHVQISPIFSMLIMAVAWLSSMVMRYVMYYLFCGWRHFSHNRANRPESKTTDVSPSWQQQGAKSSSCCSCDCAMAYKYACMCVCASDGHYK